MVRTSPVFKLAILAENFDARVIGRPEPVARGTEQRSISNASHAHMSGCDKIDSKRILAGIEPQGLLGRRTSHHADKAVGGRFIRIEQGEMWRELVELHNHMQFPMRPVVH